MNHPGSFKEQIIGDPSIEKHGASKKILAVLVASAIILGGGIEIEKRTGLFEVEKKLGIRQ